MSSETIHASAQLFVEASPNRPELDDYVSKLEHMGRITPIVQEAVDKARKVRLGHDVILYIAGPLTGMDEAVKQRYVAVSDLITSKSRHNSTMFGYAPHVHGTDPVQHPDVTPQEVRDVDYLWSAVIPDGHINFWAPVAHGNAIEAGWAEQYDIPSLHLTPDGMTTSRLVRGMHNIIGSLAYADFNSDGLVQIGNFLDHVQGLR